MKTITKINNGLESNLSQAVAETINEHIGDDESYTLKDYLGDLFRDGCASGFVSELIYYADTERFYDQFKSDISLLLAGTLDANGLDCPHLFGDKWDNTDPLATGMMNKNLLTWFAFEETARCIGFQYGIEL